MDDAASSARASSPQQLWINRLQEFAGLNSRGTQHKNRDVIAED